MANKFVTVGDDFQLPAVVQAVQTARLNAAILAATPPIKFGAGVATVGVTATDKAYAPRTLLGAQMRVAGAPVGSSLIVQVQHFNGSAWSTVATLTITSGSTIEATTTFSQAQVAGNLVRLNITSVGSGTAATGVAVDVLVG